MAHLHNRNDAAQGVDSGVVNGASQRRAATKRRRFRWTRVCLYRSGKPPTNAHASLDADHIRGGRHRGDGGDNLSCLLTPNLRADPQLDSGQEESNCGGSESNAYH
jgi:hypothetical protein